VRIGRELGLCWSFATGLLGIYEYLWEEKGYISEEKE
jgi:hypothetical protein